jgi:2-hydroxychromene-2-carboxylate isomerase
VDEPAQPIFYYDLGSPGCYLVAERIMSELPVVPEWEPVLGAALEISDARPDLDRLTRAIDDAGLQPLRLPTSWPPDSELAMLVATYAKHVGRAVAFSLAAFRQAFAGGRDLGEEGTVLIAGAACEMHPTALLKAVTLRSVTSGLRAANDRARAAGVSSLPAIQIADRVFCGDDALELATSRLTTIAGGAG